MSDHEPHTPVTGPDFVDAPVPALATESPAGQPAPAPAISPFPTPESLPASFPAPGISPEQFVGPVSAPAPLPAAPSVAGIPAPPTGPTPATASFPAGFGAPGITPPAYAASASAFAPGGEPMPAQPDVDGRTDKATVERVGRGLLFSLASIIAGVGLTMVLYQVGFIASITSFVLAYAAIRLYTLGAGAPPRKGVWAVIAVIVVGVALSLISLVVSDLVAYLAEHYPDAALADKIDFVTVNLTVGEVWAEYTKDIVMYILFAGLGTFGLIRQLGRARTAP